MNITPNTEVRLLSNVPLSNSHQRKFSSTEDQASYFISKQAYIFTDFTYQRQSSTLKLPVQFDDIYDCNYLMFRNNHYTNKYFYAYILEKEYINPNTTLIVFEIDVYQSWQFELNFNPTFIERQHMDRWSGGSPVINTIEEGLDIGTEYEVVQKYTYNNEEREATGLNPSDREDFYLVVANFDLADAKNLNFPVPPPAPSPKTVDGISTGLDYLIVKGSFNLRNFIWLLQNEEPAYLENLINISYLPAESLPTGYDANPITTWGTGVVYSLSLEGANTVKKDLNFSVDKYSDFPTVNESKLLMYPYSYAEITAYNGQTIQIPLEYVNSDRLEFEAWGFFNPNSRVAYLLKHLNNDTSLDNALIVDNFPQVATSTSGYQQFLSRSQTQLMFETGKSLVEVGAGVVTKNPAIIGAGVTSIMGTMASVQDAKRTPNALQTQAGGYGFNIANGIFGFTVKKKMIKEEYRNILEQFFHSYGYKVNRIERPNLNSRSHFNYIKTIGANITGNIPQEHTNQLREIFDSGVTIWHVNDVGNYDYSNGEV